MKNFNQVEKTVQYSRCSSYFGAWRRGGRQLAALFALAVPLLAQAETFRWVDDQGVVHYTDQLPPEESKRPRAKLNSEAKLLEMVEGQKSMEELEQLKRLAQLRLDQTRILAVQKDSDSSLMRTYRSEAEMQMALQSKLNTMDSAIKIAESNRLHQEENLKGQLKRAAEIELGGQSVPQNLRDGIESTRRQIATYQDKIRALGISKTEISASFARDLERFKNLEILRLNPELGTMAWRSQNQEADVNVLSTTNCRPKRCALAWVLAREYVKANSHKPLLTDTDEILQTSNPREETDVAILVVRIPGKTSDTLFLDTSCHASSLGDDLCSGEVVRRIRAGFGPYIENALKASDQ